MGTMFWIWASVFVLSVVLEIATSELFSIWFAFGSIIPLILSAIGVLSPVWQIAIFIVVSAVLLASLRKITKDFLLRNTDTKTNAQSLIGQKFKLAQKTDFETVGSLKINGVEWSAVGDKAQTIEEGAVVEILSISGNKLIVKEAEE